MIKWPDYLDAIPRDAAILRIYAWDYVPVWITTLASSHHQTDYPEPVARTIQFLGSGMFMRLWNLIAFTKQACGVVIFLLIS